MCPTTTTTTTTTTATTAAAAAAAAAAPTPKPAHCAGFILLHQHPSYSPAAGANEPIDPYAVVPCPYAPAVPAVRGGACAAREACAAGDAGPDPERPCDVQAAVDAGTDSDTGAEDEAGPGACCKTGTGPCDAAECGCEAACSLTDSGVESKIASDTGKDQGQDGDKTEPKTKTKAKGKGKGGCAKARWCERHWCGGCKRENGVGRVGPGHGPGLGVGLDSGLEPHVIAAPGVDVAVGDALDTELDLSKRLSVGEGAPRSAFAVQPQTQEGKDESYVVLA